MASEVEIVNTALTLLGESRVISLDDNTKPAREAKAMYAITRDALLGGFAWSFAKTRAALSPDATAPSFEYSYAYQLPVDCLRIMFVGDHYVGLDLTDYRGTQTEEFEIEGRKILSNEASLRLKYGKRVEDTTQFHPCFAKTLGAQLAYDLCEALTKGGSRKDRALAQRNMEISLAVRANAIELPPKKLPDDEWITSRL